jgi:hypothetical protein
VSEPAVKAWLRLDLSEPRGYRPEGLFEVHVGYFGLPNGNEVLVSAPSFEPYRRQVAPLG